MPRAARGARPVTVKIDFDGLQARTIAVPLIVGRALKLSPEQAKYLGVPAEGPYKPDHYRY